MSNARFGAAAIVAAFAFVAAIVCGAVRATAAGGYSDTPTADWFRSWRNLHQPGHAACAQIPMPTAAFYCAT